MPQPRPNDREPSAPPPSRAESLAPAIPVSLADGISAAPAPPPPHLLWATLESAYAPPQDTAAAADEERLPLYIALPMAVGLSLVLWLIIVELVLMRW